MPIDMEELKRWCPDGIYEVVKLIVEQDMSEDDTLANIYVSDWIELCTRLVALGECVEYARHKSYCIKRADGTYAHGKCTCGYSEAIARLEEEK